MPMNLNHNETVRGSEDCVSKTEKNGMTEKDSDVTDTTTSTLVSSETEKCERHQSKDGVVLQDSSTKEGYKLKVSNIESGTCTDSMLLPESPNVIEHVKEDRKEETSTSNEITQINQLVNEEQELSCPTATANMKELPVADTHCDDTGHGINSLESKGKISEQDTRDSSPDSDTTELNETPKKFHKNLSYHGTGRLPCPSLGDGWTIEQIVRQQGKSAGKYDTYYYSPLGTKIRSKLKLREFMNADLANFDYNSGKFMESGNVVASPKPKMSLLKTNELKTIDRSPENKLDIPSNKQQKRLLIKLPPHKKLLSGLCSSATDKKKHTKKAKKRKMPPSFTAQNVVGIIDDDYSQNNPFEAFKTAALNLSKHFEDMKDYDDLIQFAWNFLSIESKTRFNDVFSTSNSVQPHFTSKHHYLHYDSQKPEVLENLNTDNASSKDTVNSLVSQDPLGNHTNSHDPMRQLYPGDLNKEHYDSITTGSSLHADLSAVHQEEGITSDTDGALQSSVGFGNCNLKQKLHKRKSRVPVYIKQPSNLSGGNEV